MYGVLTRKRKLVDSLFPCIPSKLLLPIVVYSFEFGLLICLQGARVLTRHWNSIITRGLGDYTPVVLHNP